MCVRRHRITSNSHPPLSPASRYQIAGQVSDEKRLLGETVAAALKSGDLEWKTFGCSMMGVWGSRTADGSLYTGPPVAWVARG